MRIIDINRDDDGLVEQAAELLYTTFVEQSPGTWPDVAAARSEVLDDSTPQRIYRAAVDDDGLLAGFVGGEPIYNGRVWELHPLAVRRESRRQGIGRALVADLERIASEHGAVTLFIGADDETNATTLGGIDLYPAPLARLSELRAIEGATHPLSFYGACGFVVVGALPDANGFGKPDIFLAKRVG